MESGVTAKPELIPCCGGNLRSMVVTMVSIVFHPRKRFVVSWDKTPEKKYRWKTSKFQRKCPSKFGSWISINIQTHQNNCGGFDQLDTQTDHTNQDLKDYKPETKQYEQCTGGFTSKTIGFWKSPFGLDVFIIPQIAIAIGVLTSNRGEGDEPLWRIGRGTRVPLQGAVDVVPLLGCNRRVPL